VRTFRQRAIVANHAEMERANNTPMALWTGFDELEAQMRTGVAMAVAVCVEPRDAYQRAAYHRLQNLAPRIGYERRPPAGMGLSFLHPHFERSTHGDIYGDDGSGE
jgi:hypothetical protein